MTTAAIRANYYFMGRRERFGSLASVIPEQATVPPKRKKNPHDPNGIKETGQARLKNHRRNSLVSESHKTPSALAREIVGLCQPQFASF